jgi:hypothetical protein
MLMFAFASAFAFAFAFAVATSCSCLSFHFNFLYYSCRREIAKKKESPLLVACFTCAPFRPPFPRVFVWRSFVLWMF